MPLDAAISKLRSGCAFACMELTTISRLRRRWQQSNTENCFRFSSIGVSTTPVGTCLWHVIKGLQADTQPCRGAILWEHWKSALFGFFVVYLCDFLLIFAGFSCLFVYLKVLRSTFSVPSILCARPTNPHIGAPHLTIVSRISNANEWASGWWASR